LKPLYNLPGICDASKPYKCILMSNLINLMHPFLIKILILEKKRLTPTFWTFCSSPSLVIGSHWCWKGMR